MKKKTKLPKAALEFFREQGRKGARNRTANLTPERRSEIARQAVQARWAKQKQKEASEK